VVLYIPHEKWRRQDRAHEPGPTGLWQLTYSAGCNRLTIAMTEARRIPRIKSPQKALASFLAICMLFLVVQPGLSWGKARCSSEPKGATVANRHDEVAHKCCCCADVPPCDCDLTKESSSSPTDLAPSWTPLRQLLTYYGHTAPLQGCATDSNDGRPPSASFIFARAPSPFIYLLTLNLIC
jgi:hypothetical protein